MLQVSINTKLNVDVGGATRSIKLKDEQAIREIVDRAIYIYEEESPVREGTFKKSVKRLDERRVDSEVSTERYIRVGPTVYYATYVVNKTRESPGRYVPALGLRIRSGRHPGTKANPVAVRTKRKLEPIAANIIRNIYGNLELGKFIR